ncbi:hypothetical protein N7G274_007864 [Stereocaulon virgatum]|uniref:Transposase n=1 Tax=Stereocaulon virgatum TaxID=373712 RepID=A0ABR4A0X9_9LECA
MLEFLYLQWTIPANHEFSLIEDKNFRAFLQYVSKTANEMLPLSANTIKAMVMILFAEGKRRINHLLASAASFINITIDAWTSTNKVAFLGTVSHFVDENGAL